MLSTKVQGADGISLFSFFVPCDKEAPRIEGKSVSSIRTRFWLSAWFRPTATVRTAPN